MKFAVVGCGRIGAQPSSRIENDLPQGWLPVSHVESFLQIKGNHELALCDSDKNSVERWSAHYGVSCSYTDYRELFTKFQPDVVSIATRTPSKKEILFSACDAGVRGIYLEKPIANSLKGCHEILHKVQQSGCHLFYGVNRRYHESYRLAKQWIRNGVIGELQEINIEHGPSQLLWTHPHSMDLILFLIGSTELESVQARFSQTTFHRICENVIDSDPVLESAHFRFYNGVTANILRTRGLNVRIAGRDGILSILSNGECLEVQRRKRPDSSYFLEKYVENPKAEIGATVTALTELVNRVSQTQSNGLLNQPLAKSEWENNTPTDHFARNPSLMAPQTAISLKEIEIGTRMLFGCVWSHLKEGKVSSLSDVPEALEVTGRWEGFYA